VKLWRSWTERQARLELRRRLVREAGRVEPLHDDQLRDMVRDAVWLGVTVPRSMRHLVSDWTRG
jgi:hypothetical protein